MNNFISSDLKWLKPENLVEKYSTEFEKLKNIAYSNFFPQLEKLINKLFIEDADLHSWLAVFGVQHEKTVKKALIEDSFLEINENDSFYQEVIKLKAQKNILGHQLLEYFLDNFCSTDLLAYEKIIIKAYIKIAQATDSEYIRWRETLFYTEFGQKIQKLEKQKEGSGAMFLKENNLDNPYTVYEKRNNNWTQIAYGEKFSKEYLLISSTYQSLIFDLQNFVQQYPEVKQLINYFQVLIIAYQNISLDKMEKCWTKVDEEWVKIKTRILPVHGMESGYGDPARIRIMPEQRLLLEDLRAKEINDECDQTKYSLIKDLFDKYGEKQSLKASKNALENTSIKIYVNPILSGTNMTFRFIGQCAPNRADVRVNFGVKISMDYNRMVDRLNYQLDKTELVFGKKFRENFLTFDAKYYLTEHIAGHEVGHSAFVTIETEQRLGYGIQPLLEEAKATWCELATAPIRAKRKEIDNDILKTLFLTLLTADIRYLAYRGDTIIAPYYTGALIELNIMLTSKIIYKDNGWKVDFEKLNDFYQLLITRFEELIEIYDSLDGVKAPQFIKKYALETNEILDLWEIVK